MTIWMMSKKRRDNMECWYSRNYHKTVITSYKNYVLKTTACVHRLTLLSTMTLITSRDMILARCHEAGFV